MSTNEDVEETILINIMYTGDYTDKNIGHEIINLYKTDKWEDNGKEKGGENYIYISPYGFVTKEWNNKIKTVLFARGAGKDKIEIIAKADDLKQLAEEMGERPKLMLRGEADEEIKKEFKNIIKNYDSKYNAFIKAYNDWESKCREKIKSDTNIGIEELLKSFPEKDSIETQNDKNKKGYKEWKENNKNSININIENWERYYKNWRDRYCKWVKENSKKHLEQIKEIYSKNIKYGGQFLCDIFEGNLWDEEAIYYGFKATVSKPSKPFYIEYGEYKKSNKKNIIYESLKKTDDELSCTFKFKGAKIKNQSCIYYLEINDKLNEFENAINETFPESNETNVLEEKEIEKSFIEIIKKQDDELAYSNMFKYFLKDKEIFKKFAEKVLKRRKIDTDKIFEIKREEDKIDLLIVTDKDVFVIENKIKSGINGEKYNPYNGEYTNQLIKYHDIIENKKEYESKNKHYFIFKPNYNQITKERLKVACSENIDKNLKNAIEKYEIKNYSDIHVFFKKLATNNNKSDNYLNEFVKALEIHTSDCENIIEKEMEYKFRQKIKNKSKKEGN